MTSGNRLWTVGISRVPEGRNRAPFILAPFGGRGGRKSRAPSDELERLIGRLAHGRLDGLELVGIEGREHVVHHLLGPALRRRPLTGGRGTAYPHLDAAEFLRAQRLDDRAHPIVAAGRALHADADLAERKIEVVEDDDEPGGADAEPTADAGHRRSRDVHEAGGLDQVHGLAVPSAAGDLMTRLPREPRARALNTTRSTNT